MNRKSLIGLLAFGILATAAHAQDLKIHVNEKGKVGFTDSQGNEVVKCLYESATPFADGVAIVSKSGKSGLIDATGQVVLPLKYKSITPWTKSLYRISDSKKNGLADHSGTIVLPMKYTLLTKPNCYGKALIATGGKATQDKGKTYMLNAKYGIVNAGGEILVQPTYKGLYEFTLAGKDYTAYHEGYLADFSYHYTTDTLKTDCKYLAARKSVATANLAGVIDGSGNQILKEGAYTYVCAPVGDMIRYYSTEKKAVNCGYYNIKTGQGFVATRFNKTLKEIDYWTHGDFTGEIAPVNGSMWSFIDKSGNTLRLGYRKLSHSIHSGLWFALNSNGEWEAFDENNCNVTTLSGYQGILYSEDNCEREVFSVKKGEKWGVVTRDGSEVIPFDYDQLIGSRHDLICAKKDGKWGMLSAADGSVTIPLKYKEVNLPTMREQKDFWVQKDDELYYHFNSDKQSTSGDGYRNAFNFEDGLAFAFLPNPDVSDTPINRAQCFAPNTKQEDIDKLDWNEALKTFGLIVDTEDAKVIDLPVSSVSRARACEIIKARGTHKFSKSQMKDILLQLTLENRSYPLGSKINEDEWNF